MDIRVDTKQAVTDLKKQFAGLTNHTSFNTAIAIGLNETMKRAQSTANAAVKQRYNLNPAAINRKKLIKVSKANGKNLIAFLRASVQNIPLISFGGVTSLSLRANLRQPIWLSPKIHSLAGEGIQHFLFTHNVIFGFGCGVHGFD